MLTNAGRSIFSVSVALEVTPVAVTAWLLPKYMSRTNVEITDPVASAVLVLAVGPPSNLMLIFSEAPNPVITMGTLCWGSAVSGMVMREITEKGAAAMPDWATPTTFPPSTGSGGEIRATATEPVGSAVAETGAPPGKETATVSPGTYPMPENVVESPAARLLGLMEATGVTLTGPLPTMPLVRPTPKNVWAPPGNGAGTGTCVYGRAPFASATVVARTVLPGESASMSTFSPGVYPPPLIPTEPPGTTSELAWRFHWIVRVTDVAGAPDMPTSSTGVTMTCTVSRAVKWSGVSVG